MGFEDMLSKLGSAALNSLQEKNAKIERLMQRYEQYDDDKLKRMYRGECGFRSSDDLIAIRNVLRDRGY